MRRAFSGRKKKKTPSRKLSPSCDCPKIGTSFIFDSDASDFAIGGVRSQTNDENMECVVASVS